MGTCRVQGAAKDQLLAPYGSQPAVHNLLLLLEIFWESHMHVKTRLARCARDSSLRCCKSVRILKAQAWYAPSLLLLANYAVLAGMLTDSYHWWQDLAMQLQRQAPYLCVFLGLLVLASLDL